MGRVADMHAMVPMRYVTRVKLGGLYRCLFEYVRLLKVRDRRGGKHCIRSRRTGSVRPMKAVSGNSIIGKYTCQTNLSRLRRQRYRLCSVFN
jgi:hypothetical protein